MPIYEYKCENCGDTFEVLQNFSEEPLTECILCEKGPVKKLISVSSFVLKGAGFYVNDYPKKSTATEKKSSASTNPSSKKTSTTSSKKQTTSTKKEAAPASV